jgi:hypothetical protein
LLRWVAAEDARQHVFNMTYIPHLCPAMNNAGAGRRPIHCRGRGATFNFGRRISQTGEGALISTLPQTVSCLFRTTRCLPQSESAWGGTEKGDSGIETVGSSSPTQDNSRVTPGIAHIPLSGDARLGPSLSCGWYVHTKIPAPHRSRGWAAAKHGPLEGQPEADWKT